MLGAELCIIAAISKQTVGGYNNVFGLIYNSEEESIIKFDPSKVEEIRKYNYNTFLSDRYVGEVSSVKEVQDFISANIKKETLTLLGF